MSIRAATLDGRQDGVGRSQWRARDDAQVGKREMNTRAYLASFNFRGADQQKKVQDLSGVSVIGCISRSCSRAAAICCCSTSPRTISTSTRCARWRKRCWISLGCAVVISHDRWFLDRIATHILAFEGNSEVVWFEGNYRAYAEDFHRRKGVDADRPHRIAYKKLVRA